MYILEHAQLVFPNKFVSCFTCLRSLVKMCLLLLCYSVSRYVNMSFCWYVTLIWYSTNMYICCSVTAIMSLCWYVTLLICDSVDLSICHSVYMSLRWSVNMSLCWYVTPLICHCQYVTLLIFHLVDLSLSWPVTLSTCHSLSIV